MAGSLRDQLLKTGAASKKQAHKAAQAKRQQSKAAKRGDHSAAESTNELKRKIAEQNAEKARRDRELNRQREAERAAKQQQHAVAQIIQTNAQKAEGDEPYNFTLNNKVQRVYVSVSQRQALAGGKLAIAEHRGGFTLIPVPVARKLSEKIADKIFIADAAEASVGADDPYAGYEVPDDLIW